MILTEEPTPTGNKEQRTLVDSPSVFKAVVQSMTDMSEMRSNTFDILQRHLLNAQAEVLRSMLSTVEKRMRRVQSTPPSGSAASTAATTQHKVIIE